MDNKLLNVRVIEENDALESLENFKIEDKISQNKQNLTPSTNFFKSKFKFNESDFELGLSVYSNMVLIIITNNAKIGNMWLAEIEEQINDPLMEEEETEFELRCILGERNNEFYQVVSNMIVRKVIEIFKTKGVSLKNVMISMAFKSTDIEKNCEIKGIVEVSENTKKFIETIYKNLALII